MELRKVSVEDIYPDEKNPRKDFGDVKALAASFELNSLNPGEPVNPPVVVQDGGIYRIIDGERRYRGMIDNKLTSCHVIVCEDMTEANSMIAMLATDDKQQLTDLERSRGVQQMLLLGVEPARVEKTARLKKGQSVKVATVMAMINDAAEDMTLDRLYAIAEFTDDPEAVEKLTDCKAADWPRIADELMDKRRTSKKILELRGACITVGIPIIDYERSPEGLSYQGSDYAAADIASRFSDGIPEGTVSMIADLSWKTAAEFYAPIAEEQIDPEEEARRKKIDDLKIAMKIGAKNRAIWFSEHINNLEEIPAIAKQVRDEVFSDGYGSLLSTISEFDKLASTKTPREINAPLAAKGYMACIKELPEWIVSYIVNDDAIARYASSCVEFIKWIDDFAADGYEPTEADIEIVGLCNQYVASEQEADNASKDN